MEKYRVEDDFFEKVKTHERADVQEIEVAQRLSDILYDITEARINQGLSQQKLAELCGLKQSAIARLESLQTIPRLDTVLRVATALKLRVKVVPEQVGTAKQAIGYNFKKNNGNGLNSYSYQRNGIGGSVFLTDGRVAG